MNKTIKGTILTTKDLADILNGLSGPLAVRQTKYDKDKVIIPGWGIEIVLYVDGTYFVSDTSGG